MTFLFISAASSVPPELHQDYFVPGATLRTAEALRVFFHDRATAAGVSNTVTILET